ncbi:hypothetical protein WOB59_10845 [Methylocystis sp. IM4]|uniref:hypothetical protein n=1 Tax=Methylocystis sp. IM4 TaxID=3136560 RepID=UPI00311A4F1D
MNNEPDFEYMARAAFEGVDIGLTAAVAWIAYRDLDKAYEASFWRFSDLSARGHNFYDAKEQLWRALRENQLQANGASPRATR